jgi:hypothetical protein
MYYLKNVDHIKLHSFIRNSYKYNNNLMNTRNTNDVILKSQQC